MCCLDAYMVDCLVGEVFGWDDFLDDLLLDLLAQLLGGDVCAVLGADNDGMHTEGNDGTVIMLILYSDLGLGVGSQPRDGAVAAGSRHGSVQLVGELGGQGEEFWGLVGGVSEHNTLVTGTELLESLLVVQTLGNIGGLLLDGDEDVAGFVVETFGRIVVADVLDGIADNLLVVDTGLCGDLAEDHHHAGLGGCLTSDFGEGVIFQASVEDSIGDLVSDLVWVALSYGLGL